MDTIQNSQNGGVGKLKKVPLREIWKNEAKDFTKWLAKNIDTLNEVLESDFIVNDTEKEVGDFSLDIVAEDSEGKIVIIENQLTKTDHDHLGKVLTYLTNLGAKTAIWISSEPREEHVKTINWLNESTPDDISFYLIKLDAVKIGDSPAAPMFSIIAEPTDIGKAIGGEKKEYAERHHLRKEFWTQLLDKAKTKTSLHAGVSPAIYSWVGAGGGKMGLTFSYVITNDSISVELYLDRGKDFPMLNKERFDELFKQKEEIERTFGDKLSWERLDKKRASRIAFRVSGVGLKNKEQWPDTQYKMIDAMVRLEAAIRPFIDRLK